MNNRRFLQRVVKVLAADHGIRQFLDHGSGLPTQDNVHQVAQRIDPDTHVVYVDNDPMVLVHGRALLEQDERTAVIHADMRETDAIFSHPDTRRLIDFDQPVAVLFNSVMHCIPDSDTDGPLAVVRRVIERLVPGSFVVMCQLVSEDPEVRKFVTDFMDQATQGHWGRVRQEKDVAGWFEGTEILDPGLVEVSTWRPDSEVAPASSPTSGSSSAASPASCDPTLPLPPRRCPDATTPRHVTLPVPWRGVPCERNGSRWHPAQP